MSLAHTKRCRYEQYFNKRFEKENFTRRRTANEGWKISVFISEFREPDYNSFKDSKKIISVLRKLHGSGIKVDYGMDPWKDSLKIEKLLRKKAPECFEKNEKLKRKIELLYKKTADDGLDKCF